MDIPDVAARRLDGVVIGALMGFGDDGAPLVVFPGNLTDTALAARATCVLTRGDVGREVALLFEGADPARPVVIGRLLRSDDGPDPVVPSPVGLPVQAEGRLEFSALREIVLRCGEATITLTRAGKVLIRGAYISSWSRGAHRIKGGSVNIN